MKREDFSIGNNFGNNFRGYYIKTAKTRNFLFKSGEILDWDEAYFSNKELAVKNVYFSTKEEAEQFLTKYLENQMNERLAQVEKDIKLLEEEKARIIKENEVTYHVGQWFRDSYGLYLLAQVGYGKCSLIGHVNNKEANRLNIVKVKSVFNITQSEFDSISYSNNNIRLVTVNIEEV